MSGVAEGYPIKRRLSAIAAASALAVGGCSSEVPHPVEPLGVDSVVFVYAHGVPGSVPVDEHIMNGVPEIFQSAWDTLHEVTGVVPDEVNLRVAGRLALSEGVGSMQDICLDSDKSDFFRNMAGAAREKYDEEIGDQDLLAIVLQQTAGFECEEHDHDGRVSGARARMYYRDIVFFDGERVAEPGGEKIIVHELGHAILALGHNHLITSTGEIVEYGDRHTVMGHGSVLVMPRFFNSFEELRLGNITDSQVTTLNEIGVHSLRLSSLDDSRESACKIIRVPTDSLSLGAIHTPTNATAMYIELSPVNSYGYGVKVYLVDERVIGGMSVSPSYLLSPGMPGERHYLAKGESANFVFRNREMRIKVDGLRNGQKPDATWASLDITLQ